MKHADRSAAGQDRSAETSRAAVISAWLAPMLVGSIGARGSAPADRVIAEHAQADLTQWLRHVSQDGRLTGEQDLPIALEIALAQGLKYAANRRPGQPDVLRESRMFLAEQALEMLKSARYWFTQLTLIHALTLLNLSESKQPWDKYGAKPEAIVQHWLDVAGRERSDRSRAPGTRHDPHPFVSEAALLCVLALKTERPQRYLWIDESGVVGQVGSRNLSQITQQRRHRLWIPPSAGWSALNGRAQQLVADVLLLRNLADRGDLPPERERRLRRSNRDDLPPCITHFREALEPGAHCRHGRVDRARRELRRRLRLRAVPVSAEGHPAAGGDERGVLPPPAHLAGQEPAAPVHPAGAVAADDSDAAQPVLDRDGRPRPRPAPAVFESWPQWQTLAGLGDRGTG